VRNAGACTERSTSLLEKARRVPRMFDRSAGVCQRLLRSPSRGGIENTTTRPSAAYSPTAKIARVRSSSGTLTSPRECVLKPLLVPLEEHSLVRARTPACGMPASACLWVCVSHGIRYGFICSFQQHAIIASLDGV